ncbi:hypothetical protein EMIT07CA2_160094 [Brevibacillus sp. IT-7CA2]
MLGERGYLKEVGLDERRDILADWVFRKRKNHPFAKMADSFAHHRPESSRLDE